MFLKNGEINMGPTTIKKVSVEPVNIPLDEPFTISIGTQYSIENVIVTIELENGIKGYGEAAPFAPINGENQSTVLATLDSCKDYIIGSDASAYKAISKSLKSVFWAQVTARCAIEMALLDAFTRSLDIPLYKFLGNAVTGIETDYTVDIVPPDTARVNALKLAREGYRVLKTKVGKNLAVDIDRILAIKEGAPGCEITLDANQGFSPCEAVYFLEELQKNNIRPLLFEQPVLKSDLKGMKFVRDHTSVPVAADESVFTASDAMNVILTGCADVINIKIMKSGIVEALDIAAIARSANLKLMIGCMLESRLALGCSVHLAAGLGTFDFIDLDPHIDPGNEPFTGGPEYTAPYYSVSNVQGGIGVQKR
jgi:L-alanine-DL-glutamate epimerase-like enolase superfamily enzyme